MVRVHLVELLKEVVLQVGLNDVLVQRLLLMKGLLVKDIREEIDLLQDQCHQWL